MIGIVVPAHNEEKLIEACLQSLNMAAVHPALQGEPVEIIVVLDSCDDRTGHLARSLGAKTLDIQARNVGLARQLGAQAMLATGARWLSFTDADSVVGPDWLVAQLAENADAVCGTVEVIDWEIYGVRMARHFELTYEDADGHHHIHGANLGVSADAYRTAGGFLNLETSEDCALVEALESTGARIAWSRKPRVTTSARPSFRAPGGFGATLERIEKLREWVGFEDARAA